MPDQPHQSTQPKVEWSFAGIEPSLEQLLSDPITRQLMARDGQAPSALTQKRAMKEVA